MEEKKLTHLDQSGKANMVDVGEKPECRRTAVAEGFIYLQNETLQMIRENTVKKGDVLSIAEIAGIMAAKKTPELIPLCHQINLNKVEVRAIIHGTGVRITATAKCTGKTGVEMEALTAVSIGLLTIYDMCKAVDKTMKISDIVLLEKRKNEIVC
jgi:cyclic pyranopterin monophosphate synthase